MFYPALTAALLLAQPTEGTVPAPAATHVPAEPGAAVAPEARPAPSYDDLLRRIEALEKTVEERTSRPQLGQPREYLLRIASTQISQSLPIWRWLARVSATKPLRRLRSGIH